MPLQTNPLLKPGQRVKERPSYERKPSLGCAFGTVVKTTYREYHRLDPNDSYIETVHVMMDHTGKVSRYHPSTIESVE
jgi:hypothetical protein